MRLEFEQYILNFPAIAMVVNLRRLGQTGLTILPFCIFSRHYHMSALVAARLKWAAHSAFKLC